jgi:DNA invertase Pin-like site-specific DNA recombinase
MTDRLAAPEVKRAVIYVRISQDKTGEQLGVERQESECRDLAARLGYEVTCVYKDNDISATKGKERPDFERLLRDKPSVVIVWHTDRLVRLTRDLERVLDAVGTVHAVTAGDLDLSTPAGRAVARTITAWATYEGEQKAERQRAEHRQRAQAGKPWWRQRPMGYETDGTLRPDEAELVRHAYREFLRGASLRDIARQWTASGYRLLNGKEPGGADVRRILASPRNAAMRTYHNEVIAEATWPAIVPEDTWLAATAKLSDPKRRLGTSPHGREPQHLLSGLAVVTCGKCGRTVKMGDKASTYSRYSCQNKCVAYPMPWLDAVVLLHVLAALPYHRAAAESLATDDAAERVRELEAALVGLEHKRDELAERYATGELTLTAYGAAEAAVAKRVGAVSAELDSMTVRTTTAREVAANWSLSATEVLALELGERRQLITDVLESVKVYPRGKGRSPLTMRTVEVATRATMPSWYDRQLAGAARQVGPNGVPLPDLAELAQRWRGQMRAAPKSREAELMAEAWGEEFTHPGEE